MMLRQEAALDRSIDRKVRILLRLRKEFSDLLIAPTGQDDGARMENVEEATDSNIVSEVSQRREFANLPITPPGQDDGGRMENIEDVPDRDSVSAHSQGVETVESLKMKERRGNVVENKRSGTENRERILNLLRSDRPLDAGGRIDGEIPHLAGGIEVSRTV